MPGGRGYGGGRGGGRRRMLFLQSSLLVLLLREPGHGYSLMSGLEEFGFDPAGLDISIVYRALRDLESAGLVSDSWDEKSLGPPRRVYSITPHGESALAAWVGALREQRTQIEALEKAYEKARNRNGE
ncbi:helix-turn-helix transcriptional regulator [Salinispira pacifica]